jgi:DNA-binding beta-propeller fold protein YncE
MAASLGALLAPAVSAAPTRLYVTSASTDAIYGFVVGPGGTLAPLPGATVASGAEPLMLSFSPDGRSLYATDESNGSTSIWQYDVADDGSLSPKSPATATAGGLPRTIAVSPDGRFAYSANLEGDNVTRFSVGANGELEPQGNTPVGNAPHGIAISPDGESLYVSFAGGTAQFDVGADGSLTPKTPAVHASGSGGEDIQITPDGSHLYIATSSGLIRQFDVDSNGLISSKDPASADIDADAECEAVGLALAPSVPSLHSGCVGPSSSTRNISSFSIGEDGALARVQDLTVDDKALWHAAVTPDGANVYMAAALGAGTLELDLGLDGALTEGLTASPPHDPRGLAIRPWQGPEAAFGVLPAPPAQATLFDAGATLDRDGTVARYDWDFGDGVTLEDGGPSVAHVYDELGTYTVTLTVTDDDGISTENVYTGHATLRNGSQAAVASAEVEVSETPAQQPPPPPGQLEPDWEETVLIEPAGGSVRVKLPGEANYTALEALTELPEGTRVDTRSGTARVTSAPDQAGGAQTADFFDGVFKLTYEGGTGAPVTQASLVSKLTCSTGARARAAAQGSTGQSQLTPATAARRKRRLWGDGQGRFRTKGRYGAGTVRGTKWFVQDDCSGTLIKVARGSVVARDLVLKKNILLKAGKRSRYRARANAKAAKR